MGRGLTYSVVVHKRTKGGGCQKCPVLTNVIYEWPLSEISVILVCFESLYTQKDLSCSRLENKALLAQGIVNTSKLGTTTRTTFTRLWYVDFKADLVIPYLFFHKSFQMHSFFKKRQHLSQKLGKTIASSA